MVNQTLALQRQNAHVHAKNLMAKGEFTQAVDDILHAMGQYGDHVGLMADLAICFYHSGQIYKWRSCLQKLVVEFSKCRLNLSPSSRLRTAVVLAKFFEEEGEVVKAIDILQQEANLFADLSVDGRDQLKLMANFLRLKALAGESSGLGAIARAIAASRHWAPADLQVEIEHGLMLHELELEGPHLALRHLENCFKRVDLSKYDRELIIFDFLETCLARGFLGFVQLLEGFWAEPTESDFAQQIQTWLLTPAQQDWAWSFSQGEMPLTTSEFIRLGLLYARHTQSAHSEEIKSRLDILLGDLSAESRRVWLARLTTQESLEILKLSTTRKIIECRGQQFSLSKKPLMFAVLEVLALQSRWSTDEFCRKLWGCDFNEEQYTRIRVMVFRINKVLVDGFSIKKLIDLNKQTITLGPSFKIYLQE